MSETLLTCPWCRQPNFTERGLRAHVCRSAPGAKRRQLSGPALHQARKAAGLVRVPAVVRSSPSLVPVPMAKTNTLSALALVGSAELKADSQQLALLQASAAEQFRRLRLLRGEESTRGLLLGLQLTRIRHSMPHGDWGKWLKANATLSERWVNYLMRLSLVFIDKAKATKPELLACPGDQTELTLDTLEGEQRRFVQKVLKFVSDLSLSELMEKHGIKETKKLGGKRTKGDDNEAAATPEQLAQAARDEIGTGIQSLEQLLLTENRLQYLVADEAFLRGTVESLKMLAAKTAALARDLLKAAKPAKPA